MKISLKLTDLIIVNKLKALILAVFCILIIPSFAQTPIPYNYNLKGYISSMNSLAGNTTEKIHLHIDRNIYSPGEDIWFKAYLLEGTKHYPVTTSNNLYVELISPQGNIIDKKTIFIQFTCGNGDFHLEQDLPGGKYQIRAYTNFMRNFDEGNFFIKEIMVMKSDSDGSIANRSEPAIDLQFFPEGGNLVSGIKSKVAFKAINEAGKGVDINFSIYNQDNALVSKGFALLRGMGYLYLKPGKNESYYAILEGDKTQKRYPLPDINNEGYTIQVIKDNMSDGFEVKIDRNFSSVNNEKVRLAIQTRGVLCYYNDIEIIASQGKMQIPDNFLPEGISSLILFDMSGIPVAERLLFNSQFNKVNVKIVEVENEKDINGEVKLTIESTDKNGEPIPANLSLSVTEKFKSDSIAPSGFNIFSQILLNSDLKGNIEDPDYYFSEENPLRKQHLDLLMLTNGWRRYIWSELVMKESVNFPFDFENGFGFTGRVRRLLIDRPIENAKTSLTIISDGFYFDEAVTDENGEFHYDNVLLYDSTYVIVQSYNKRGKQSSLIEFNQNSYSSAPVSFRSQLFKKESDKTIFDDYQKQAKAIEYQNELMTNKHIILDDITVKASKIEKDDGHFRIYGRADHVIKADEISATYNSVFEMIQGRVPGVRISGLCPDVSVTIRGISSLNGSNEPLCLIDGMTVELAYLCDISTFDVETIEVLSGPSAAIFGSRGANGAIAVYLKKGGSFTGGEPSVIGISRYCAKGYYRARQLYKPKYDAADVASLPNARTTLFWLPYVVTDSLGRAEVSYLNSQKEAEYDIIIEGTGMINGLAHEKISYKTRY